MFGRLQVRHVVFLLCLALNQTCSAAVPGDDAAASQGAAPSAVRADIAFVCLWWSEAQMEGMNPNAPPPKKTEVRITKWEYSDPVGVPHPDVVDIVVTLANGGNQGLSNLEVEVASEWREGSLRAAAGAVWSQPSVIRKFPEVSLGSSGQQVLRVTVNLKEKMEFLGKQQKWPYSLRATVIVRDPHSVQPLAHVRAELPIRRAD